MVKAIQQQAQIAELKKMVEELRKSM